MRGETVRAVPYAVDEPGGVGCVERCPRPVDGPNDNRRVCSEQPRGEQVQSVRIAAPPGRRRREAQLFAEQALAQRGKERKQRRVLEHTGAEPVDKAHAAPANRLGQPRDAELRVSPQLEGVAPFGIHATQNDVDALPRCHLGPSCGFHPDLAVSHDEVCPLHEREAEHARQECLVVGGF